MSLREEIADLIFKELQSTRMSAHYAEPYDHTKALVIADKMVALLTREIAREVKAALREPDLLLARWHEIIYESKPHDIRLEHCEKELRAALYPKGARREAPAP